MGEGEGVVVWRWGGIGRWCWDGHLLVREGSVSGVGWSGGLMLELGLVLVLVLVLYVCGVAIY